MILIGDIHGKFDDLRKICSINPDKLHIGIGDIGLGFGPKIPELPQNFKFFRGNHDKPSVCKNHPQSLGDWGSITPEIFFVAGADSIDKKWRTEGVNWWHDEELSDEDLQKVMNAYLEAKPRILLSHEAPFSICELLKAANEFKHGEKDPYGFGPVRGTRTAFKLNEMLSQHLPECVIFGHWHVNLQIKPRNNATFICLDELNTLEI